MGWFSLYKEVFYPINVHKFRQQCTESCASIKYQELWSILSNWKVPSNFNRFSITMFAISFFFLTFNLNHGSSWWQEQHLKLCISTAFFFFKLSILIMIQVMPRTTFKLMELFCYIFCQLSGLVETMSTEILVQIQNFGSFKIFPRDKLFCFFLSTLLDQQNHA